MNENEDDNTFDSADPMTWPDDSFAGHERELADALDDDTMDALTEIVQGSLTDFSDHSFAFYTMLMMHEGILLAATGTTEANRLSRGENILKLKDYLQIEANENSGDYFETRLRQRLEEGG